jgi:S1-C subfamily serine protease
MDRSRQDDQATRKKQSMNAVRVLGLTFLLAGTMAGAYLIGQVGAQRTLITSDEINTVKVAQDSLPAVVRIDNRVQRDQLQPGDDPIVTGTGFFYKKDLIVTNYHVIEFQDSLSVTLFNGRKVSAKIEGVDPGIDIAILRVTGVTAPKTLSFGNSTRLIPGQKIIAIGTPLKVPNVVSMGMYSVMATADHVPRNDALGTEIGEYLLTTASIQEGSSGGPPTRLAWRGDRGGRRQRCTQRVAPWHHWHRHSW